MLTFDPVEHRYFWDGKPVPNVTRVLDSLTDYSRIPAAQLETARQKGVAVHRMVELHAKGDLDETTLPEWMQPVYAQWLKFVADTGFKAIAAEHKVFHPTYRYAGTLDLFGLLNGKLAFVDVKRSFLAGGVIGLQLAAYLEAHAAQEEQGKNAKRYALKLNENGPYRLEPYEDKDDFQNFLICLAHFNLKQRFNP